MPRKKSTRYGFLPQFLGDTLEGVGGELVEYLNDPNRFYDAYRYMADSLLNSSWPPPGLDGEYILRKLERMSEGVQLRFSRPAQVRRREQISGDSGALPRSQWESYPGGIRLSFSTEDQEFYFYLACCMVAVPRRLRRCRACPNYFYDSTLNASKLSCSPRCTTRYWNRSRRRKASHAQYRRSR